MFASQPIDRVRDYFGMKISLYFVWLGFYTYMLIPASVVGVLCLIYGAATMSKDYFSEEICNSDIVMCPQCDGHCDFWKLTEACNYSRITYMFDNDVTIAFAMFMSFWSIVYLEMWKRYSAEMTYDWGLFGYDVNSEYPRPEYLAKRLKKDKISFWKDKFPNLLFSFSIALFIVSDYNYQYSFPSNIPLIILTLN